MSQYNTLLLDLDDTLSKSSLVYSKALRFATQFLVEKYDLDAKKFYKKVEEKHFIVHNNFPRVHTRHSRILVFRMALDDFIGSKKYDLGLLPYIEDMYWDYFLKNITVFDEVYDTLEILKQQGIKTAIVSDGDLSLRIRKLKATNLLRFMDEVVASEEVIFEKPFSAIYTLALSRLNSEPKQTIMLGNDYRSDVRGPQMVGIRAGIFKSSEYENTEGQDGTVKPDFEIKQFKDLIKEFK